MCESEKLVEDRRKLEHAVQKLVKEFEVEHKVFVGNLRLYHQALIGGGIEPCGQVVAYTGSML